MRLHVFVKRSLLFTSLSWLAFPLFPLVTHADEKPANQADDQPLQGAIIVPPKDRLGDVSPGAVEDSLKACLARIPENASMGQRMLAELTCQREEESRKSYQRAPHF
jgi:hypothetical protein